MKLHSLILATAFAFALPVYAADKHDHTPKHGGVLVETKDLDFELVAKPDTIQLHLSDHGKPIDHAKATAKVTILVGTAKQEIELKPAGGKLEAKGNFKVGPGTKAVAQVTFNGKSSTARFALK